MSRLNLPKSHLVAGLLVLAVYLTLAWATALTERPGTDEGYFANPAFNLMSKGSFTTTVLETAGTSFQGMDRHTYWVMPLQPLVLAGWYKVLGFGVFSTRALSIFFGLVALVAWFIIVRSLFNQVFLAFLVVALLSCDYIFIVCAASGRMDMMSAALGFAGLAIYLLLRESRLTLAVLLGNALVVASGLTHPMGLLPLLGLIFLAIYFDRKRIGLKHIAVAVVPYAVGGIGWGLYILQDPQASKPQHGERKDAREATHQCIDEAERRAIHAYDPKLTDDPADRRPLPCPEPDVIREDEEKDHVAAAFERVQHPRDDQHQDHVERERGET